MIWLLIVTLHGKEHQLMGFESFDRCFRLAAKLQKFEAGCRPIEFFKGEK